MKPSSLHTDSAMLRAKAFNVAHAVVIALSVMLIVFISYDTFNNIPFLADRAYMNFQLCVCLVFMADFFVELFLTPRGSRRGYVRSRWLYLFLSIPWLTIINRFNIILSADCLYFIRFVPLARGGLALVIVLDYISANRITGIFVSYVSILVLTTYFAALIFYEREHPVNPHVESYWNAFIWCALQTTTLGSPVAPVTVAGKIISLILSFMGIIMYPLFTVYLSSLLVKHTNLLNLIKLSPKSVKSSPDTAQTTAPVHPPVAQTDKKS